MFPGGGGEGGCVSKRKCLLLEGRLPHDWIGDKGFTVPKCCL